MASQQPDPLALFFKIIDTKGSFHAIGDAVKDVVEAIEQDAHFAKFADVMKAARALEKSHALQHAMALLAELGKWATNLNIGIPAGVRGLLALMGDVESERYAAWLILFRWRHQSDISKVERDRLLILALGWQMQSIGACTLTASRLGAEDTVDVVSLLGYTMAAEIKSLRLDSSNLETLVDREIRDAPVELGDRYTADAWSKKWLNTIDADHGLTEYCVGSWGASLYTTGAESPLLAIGATAARVKARTGQLFATLCDAIINNPADMHTCWHLIDGMRHDKSLDLSEEVEALLAHMAFAGDRQALLEAAAYATRRGYHTADKSLMVFALGALAVASGARETSQVEPNDNPVDTTIEQAGEYIINTVVEKSTAVARGRIQKDMDAFQAAETAIGEERRADEEAEREAAKVSCAADDLIDDEIESYTHQQKITTAPKSTTLSARLAAMRAADEKVKVIGSIGNADSLRDDLKRAMAAFSDLLRPQKMAEMPADLAAWRQALLQEFPHCVPAIGALHGDLISRQMNGKRGLIVRPTLLVGSPGCGKSRLARRIAESLKVGYRVFPCGGVADSHFGGVSRGWHSSHPSSPLDLIRQTGAPNPVMVLDELEKSATSKHNGNFHDTLLSMLEVETAKAWQDPFVQGPINISAICWLATANSLAGIPAPLLDRMRVIHVDSPSLTHLPALAANILSEIGTSLGHDQWHQPLDGVELNAVGKAWSRQPSIRYLRRLIEGCLRAREQVAAKH